MTIVNGNYMSDSKKENKKKPLGLSRPGKLELNKTIELPRVSPRLYEQGLFHWLQKAVTKAFVLE